eukprot:gene8498-10250_t
MSNITPPKRPPPPRGICSASSQPKASKSEIKRPTGVSSTPPSDLPPSRPQRPRAALVDRHAARPKGGLRPERAAPVPPTAGLSGISKQFSAPPSDTPPQRLENVRERTFVDVKSLDR